jgi:adenosylcobinamide-GDP ribazoletransferase
MRHELRLFFIALQFFTRVPVPRWVGFEPAWLHDSARHFPAVGLLVGAVAAGVLAGAAWVTSPAVAVVLSMAATVVLTGAFHEDGFADTCDGLGGHVSRERALEIMKDSRIGSYGAVGLVLVLGLKAATLGSLPVALAVPALLLAHTVSRAMAVVLIRALPYAGDVAAAKAKPLAQGVSSGGTAVALGWAAVVAAGLVAWRPVWWPAVLLSVVLAAMGAWACARCWRRRLGGFTGDTLGATQQVTEVLVLLGWLAWLRFAGFWA